MNVSSIKEKKIQIARNSLKLINFVYEKKDSM